MVRHVKSRLAAVTLLAVALAACDRDTEPQPADTQSPSDDEEAWKSDLSVEEEAWKSDLAAELGQEDFDFEGIQDLTAEDCKNTSPRRWIRDLTSAGAEDDYTADVTRINLRHACADVLVAYEKAWGALHDETVTVEELCSVPLHELTIRDRLNAQTIC